MARAKVDQYSTNPDLNTDVGGVNIGEGSLAKDSNNAKRMLMSHIAATPLREDPADMRSALGVLSVAEFDERYQFLNDGIPPELIGISDDPHKFNILIRTPVLCIEEYRPTGYVDPVSDPVGWATRDDHAFMLDSFNAAMEENKVWEGKAGMEYRIPQTGYRFAIPVGKQGAVLRGNGATIRKDGTISSENQVFYNQEGATDLEISGWRFVGNYDPELVNVSGASATIQLGTSARATNFDQGSMIERVRLFDLYFEGCSTAIYLYGDRGVRSKVNIQDVQIYDNFARRCGAAVFGYKNLRDVFVDDFFVEECGLNPFTIDALADSDVRYVSETCYNMNFRRCYVNGYAVYGQGTGILLKGDIRGGTIDGANIRGGASVKSDSSEVDLLASPGYGINLTSGVSRRGPSDIQINDPVIRDVFDSGTGPAVGIGVYDSMNVTITNPDIVVNDVVEKELYNALATTNGTPTLTVRWFGHNKEVGDRVIISGATDIGGISAAIQINKQHRVASVLDSARFTITLGANATSSVWNGGGTAAKVLSWPLGPVTATVANALSSTNGSTSLAVAWVAHGRKVGDRIAIGSADSTFLTAAGLVSSNVNRRFLVASVPTVDSLTVTMASAATATVALGGGAGMTLTKWEVNTDRNTHVGVVLSGCSDTEIIGGKIQNMGSAVYSPAGASKAAVHIYSSRRLAYWKSSACPANPVATNNGAVNITINAPDHQMIPGSVITVLGFGGGNGLVAGDVDGPRRITALSSANSDDVVVIALTVAATATGSTGGSGMTIQVWPLMTFAGSTSVRCYWPNHGQKVGVNAIISGAADTGGIVAANINGSRAVIQVLDENHFVFTAGAAAASEDNGGDNAGSLAMTVRSARNNRVRGLTINRGWGADSTKTASTDGETGILVYETIDTRIGGNFYGSANGAPVHSTQVYEANNTSLKVYSEVEPQTAPTTMTAGTGTPNTGAFAAFAGSTPGAAYAQAEAQAVANAARDASQRVLAVEQEMKALRTALLSAAVLK